MTYYMGYLRYRPMLRYGQGLTVLVVLEGPMSWPAAAKLLQNGRSQATRLPKELRFRPLDSHRLAVIKSGRLTQT